MNEQKDIEKIPRKDGEVDLAGLAGVIWYKRTFILKITALSLAFGVIIAFTTKVEYEASCRLMPETQDGVKSGLGSLSGLAGLAGINLDMGAQKNLSPMLYPEIVKSVPFQLELINQPIRFQKLDSTMSSLTYFKEYDSPSLLGWLAEYTIGLPGKIKELILGEETLGEVREEVSGLIRLNREEWKLIESYRKRVTVVVDEKTGVISVSTIMPDSYAAARMAELVVNMLTEDIADYKMEKVSINLEFIQQRYKEAKENYELKQTELANFIDSNKNITSSLVQNQYQGLQNDLNIAYEIYKGLATQLEQTKIRVKEETPVFTLLEPVRVPIDKSKPKRAQIMLMFLVIGLIMSVAIVTRKFIFKILF